HLLSVDLSDTFLHHGLHPESLRFHHLKCKNPLYQYFMIPPLLALPPVPISSQKCTGPSWSICAQRY
ncbi:hypothetical protein BX666DRAFT_2084159, partial [Dichotomocladium elegans]